MLSRICPICRRPLPPDSRGQRRYHAGECAATALARQLAAYRERTIQPLVNKECPVCGKGFVCRGNSRVYCGAEKCRAEGLARSMRAAAKRRKAKK